MLVCINGWTKFPLIVVVFSAAMPVTDEVTIHHIFELVVAPTICPRLAMAQLPVRRKYSRYQEVEANINSLKIQIRDRKAALALSCSDVGRRCIMQQLAMDERRLEDREFVLEHTRQEFIAAVDVYIAQAQLTIDLDSIINNIFLQ